MATKRESQLHLAAHSAILGVWAVLAMLAEGLSTEKTEGSAFALRLFVIGAVAQFLLFPLVLLVSLRFSRLTARVEVFAHVAAFFIGFAPLIAVCGIFWSSKRTARAHRGEAAALVCSAVKVKEWRLSLDGSRVQGPELEVRLQAKRAVRIRIPIVGVWDQEGRYDTVFSGDGALVVLGEGEERGLSVPLKSMHRPWSVLYFKICNERFDANGTCAPFVYSEDKEAPVKVEHFCELPPPTMQRE